MGIQSRLWPTRDLFQRISATPMSESLTQQNLQIILGMDSLDDIIEMHK